MKCFKRVKICGHFPDGAPFPPPFPLMTSILDYGSRFFFAPTGRHFNLFFKTEFNIPVLYFNDSVIPPD